MLLEPMIEHLKKLRLTGFIKELETQIASNSYANMSFEERISLLIEREILERDNKALGRRLAKAKFRQRACLENVKLNAQRGIEKTLLKQLASCEWIGTKKNLIFTGPSGVGKSYLASALAHKACLLGYTSRYYRAAALYEDLASARLDGSFKRVINRLGKISVLIIDDWALHAISEQEQKDLFELIDERHENSSTIFTSQTPVSKWHELMPNPTIADAILDRIIHKSHRLELKGESLRKEESMRVDN